MKGYIRAALLMAACTVVGTLLMDLLSLTDIAMLHLIGVGVVAARATRRQAVFAALLSVALFDFFFVPPRFTFAVSDLHYVVTFGVMLVTASVISWLADREVAEWAFRMWQPAGAGTAQFPTARSVYLPLVGTHGRLGVIELRPDDPDRFAEPAVRWLLQTFAAQAALALERTLPV